MHRARSVILTAPECVPSLVHPLLYSTVLQQPADPSPADRLVEIRAAQRTFEGAYVRTALSQFSFALVVLKCVHIWGITNPPLVFIRTKDH